MLQLKPAQASDYEYARQVHHTAYKDMVTQQFGKWEEHVQDAFFDKSWKHSPYDILYVDDERCGYCCIKESATVIQLLEVAVDISKQGRGIGSMLLTTFKELGQEKGKAAQLNVMKTNTKARALYERLGFRVYGENPYQFLMCDSD